MTRIAIMSSWNAACGVSTHAELIGDALLRKGFDLTVFAPRQYVDDSTYLINTSDEHYVKRVYDFQRYGDRYIDPNVLQSAYLDSKWILDTDFDLLLIEKPTSMPLPKLIKILPKIKKKAKVIGIIHEGLPILNPFFEKIDWDALIIFDERYRKFLPSSWESKIYTVPFPCYPLDSSYEARKYSTDSEATRILSYNRVHDLQLVLRGIEIAQREIGTIEYTLLLGSIDAYEQVKKYKNKYHFLDVKVDRPSKSTLRNIQCESDVILFNTRRPTHIALSSSVHFCLSTLTPILCNNVSYFDMFSGEVIKYGDCDDLSEKLVNLMRYGANKVLHKAEEYCKRYSADKISEQILDIAFNKLNIDESTVQYHS
ncbi:MAG: hypothetical protein DRH33_05880 [Candidatus Nealsonbacteria bacterium]|nr:MAG: hypothetical protein DRH33_05880 [Candidatus Nealsonbacteria bacterium]